MTYISDKTHIARKLYTNSDNTLTLTSIRAHESFLVVRSLYSLCGEEEEVLLIFLSGNCRILLRGRFRFSGSRNSFSFVKSLCFDTVLSSSHWNSNHMLISGKRDTMRCNIIFFLSLTFTLFLNGFVFVYFSFYHLPFFTQINFQIKTFTLFLFPTSPSCFWLS